MKHLKDSTQKLSSRTNVQGQAASSTVRLHLASIGQRHKGRPCAEASYEQHLPMPIPLHRPPLHALLTMPAKINVQMTISCPFLP